MPDVSFDLTIRLGDLVLFGGGMVAFLRMVILHRDETRELRAAIGTTEPQAGLRGDVAVIKKDIRETRDETYRHREILIARGFVDPFNTGVGKNRR